MNTEIELKRLENDVKSLKEVYPVAASKVKFYVFSSPEFHITGSQEARFKFTPSYGRGRLSFTRLSATARIGDNPTVFAPEQVNEPQDGSGSVVIKIRFENYSPDATYHVKLMASGTSPGTFTQI